MWQVGDIYPHEEAPALVMTWDFWQSTPVWERFVATGIDGEQGLEGFLVSPPRASSSPAGALPLLQRTPDRPMFARTPPGDEEAPLWNPSVASARCVATIDEHTDVLHVVLRAVGTSGITPGGFD